MSDLDVQPHVTPPATAEDGDGDEQHAMLTVSWMGDRESVGADVSLYGDDCQDPARFADAVLRAALGLAHLRGQDHVWALMQRFTAYDGGAP